MFDSIYQNRDVLVTGHTGFKGSWLCQWLLELGARVHGLALDPQPHERLYDQLGLTERLTSDVRGDIRQPELVREVVDRIAPDFLFHLAAQPLVRLSFEQPVATYATNVMGTVHVLEAVRQTGRECNVVCITTDKCYENREWLYAYREVDPMGGYDPYSASKGCAELVIASYRNSYFRDAARVRLASARAGNVIGGGDWAVDRIVPDIMRSLRRGVAIPVRNKHATRPWQHVLEPLSGYLWLGSQLDSSSLHRKYPLEDYCSAFNFGPNLSSNRTVAEVVAEVLTHIAGSWQDCSDPHAVHEAAKLNLAIDKAFHLLDWEPTWDFSGTISQTVAWYQAECDGADVVELTRQHIADYCSTASQAGRRWARSSASPVASV